MIMLGLSMILMGCNMNNWNFICPVVLDIIIFQDFWVPPNFANVLFFSGYHVLKKGGSKSRIGPLEAPV